MEFMETWKNFCNKVPTTVSDSNVKVTLVKKTGPLPSQAYHYMYSKCSLGTTCSDSLHGWDSYVKNNEPHTHEYSAKVHLLSSGHFHCSVHCTRCPVCVYVCMCVCVCVCECVCMYVCVCTCMCVHVDNNCKVHVKEGKGGRAE